MPLVRMIVNVRANAATLAKDAVVNTLYFNVTEDPFDPTDYQNLVDDLWAVWGQFPWASGRQGDIRAYNMSDAQPRPIKAQKLGAFPGSVAGNGVPQVALCLSYYADRNLPSQRGRIFLGPWSTTNSRPDSTQMQTALNLAQQLADIGGINVDWSLWSPKRQDHTRISNAWVDNAWDIIRGRRLNGTSRITWSGDG